MVDRPSDPLDGRPAVAIFRAPVFNPSETFIQAQAASLSRYRPVIVGMHETGPVRGELERATIMPAGAGERLAFLLTGSVAAMAARLRPLAPQLVHAHFGPDGLAALPLARALGVPLVTTLHGYDVARSRFQLLRSGRPSWWRYALFRRRLIRSGALFLAVSEAVRRRAIGNGFPAERVLVHAVGVDLARFRPSPSEVEPGLVLHVGRLVEKKGTADLLAAFARLRERRPDARLAIVGDGPLRRALEKRSAALGLDPQVRFLGALPPEALAGLMRRAWLIAAPSVTARDGDAEGLPTVLAEAAASGLPAVATVHSGIPEIVQDGATGFLVPEHDVAGLVERMDQLLGDPSLRGRQAAAARSLAEAAFDLGRQTALLEDHYDRLLGRAGAGNIRPARSR